MRAFTQFEQDIAAALIARCEGRPVSPEMHDYMAAFDGGFEPDKLFTLHLPTANRVILYHCVLDMSFLYMERSLFNAHCDKIKKNLIDIADFITFLADNDYIEIEYKKNLYYDIPPALTRKWRRCLEFFPAEAASILFVKSITPIPTQKLRSILPAPYSIVRRLPQIFQIRAHFLPPTEEQDIE
ncbi:MAG: hypothetical protein LBD20_08965 [Spirochaetaceae bacterium]|jgi:hypothetical protein|nr:hypothetical protein [Spirochaetaceae bacterium]